MAEPVAKLELVGGKELAKLLQELPADIARRARRRGVRRAALKLRNKLRRDAPESGLDTSGRGKDPTLRKSIKHKNRKVKSYVGLATRFYYETLDLQSARGAPLAPWFEKSAERHAPEAGRLIVDETNKAIAFEAGKAYRRSLERVRRRRRSVIGV